MNDIFIIILTAIVGVVGTILTQTITRRMRLPEIKRKQSLKNLQNIKMWIEAYRALFKCQYPMAVVDDIFVLLNDKSSDNKIASKRVYSALKQFQDVNAKCDEAKRVGQPALMSFKKTNWLEDRRDDFFNAVYRLFGLRWLYQIVSAITDNNGVVNLARNIYEWADNIVLDFIVAIGPRYNEIPKEYRWGLPGQIYPHLKTIDKQRYKLFDNFPSSFFYVEWKKLDFIEPENVVLIIDKASLGSLWPGGLEERYEWKSWGITIWDDLEDIERTARYAIDDILNIIQEYESKLLLEVEISNDK